MLFVVIIIIIIIILFDHSFVSFVCLISPTIFFSTAYSVHCIRFIF